MKALVLASASPYRAMQLRQLHIPFETCRVNCREQPLANETPRQMASRLATLKACTALQQHADAIIIGGDQVPELDGRALRKPGSLEIARQQLAECSGQSVVFHTGIAVVSTHGVDHVVVETRVLFRALDAQMIQRYVQLDKPTDCAGAFRIESLAPVLLQRVTSDDPTALLGLPLLGLCELLAKHGLDVLEHARTGKQAG